MTELEKKAYTYAANRLADPDYPRYNDETEIADAYEQGYKDAVDKVKEYMIDKFCEFMQSCEGYVVSGEKCNYDNFMKFIEEHQ